MGHVYNYLAGADVTPERWPHHVQFSIEDCETVHLHLNNFRLDFTRAQFLDFALVIEAAAAALKEEVAHVQARH